MKLIDIAKRIDKSSGNSCDVDTYLLGEELSIEGMYYFEQDRITCYWIGKWYCTDTYVGYRMYFLDDIPVAYSEQHGRKSDQNFEWFSYELAEKTRKYLVSLLGKKNDFVINTVDIETDVKDYYTLEYNTEIIKRDKITYMGEPVEITKEFKNTRFSLDTELEIKLPNNERKIVEIGDLKFGIHIV